MSDSVQNTSLSKAIADLLAKEHLLSAKEILEHFKKQGHTYNKTSVYRALEQLLKKNEICQHHFADDEARYELREDHHSHLVCMNCGKVSNAECTYKQPQNIGSFQVDHHHTTLFGLCENCQ